MDLPLNVSCYTDDWKRTHPDFVLYLPPKPCGPDGDNEHLHVVSAPKSDDLLATWSVGAYECAPNTHSVFSRSRDGGTTWTTPQPIPGTNDAPILGGRWGFPIVSRSGRIYFFSNKCIGFWDTAVCGRDAAAIAKAIRHAANIMGVDNVALGSDFDGAIEAPFDATGVVQITDALLREGFEEDEIKKIMGENVIRTLQLYLP